MRRRPIIELLPESTRSELRSTQILTSLAQLVSELVQNSLDAGATQIDVGVDPATWACWVRDDGIGMPREGLDLLAKGKEEGRYGTSKPYGTTGLDTLSAFGFRGEALASAVDVACVEISSRTAESSGSWSIILKGGSKLYSGPALRWRRERPGTIVNIKDAFYNFPVRRSSHPTPVRTLENTRRDIEAFALMFPQVGFTLENSAKEREDGSGKGRLLTIVKATSTLTTFRQLYGKALVQHVETIKEQMGNIHVEGFISKEGSHSKSYRFLYVNQRLVNYCELNNVVDAKFAAITFGKKALDESGEPAPHPASRRSPRKNERRPVYVLNIRVPTKSLDLNLEPTKTNVYFEDLDTVVTFLGRVVGAFLTRNGFPPHIPHKALPNDGVAASPSAAKRRRLDNAAAAPVRPRLPIGSEDDKSHNIGTSTRKNSPSESAQASIIAFPDSESTDGGRWTSWREPVTGEAYTIDLRSGNSFRQGRGREEHEDENADIPSKTDALVDRRWLRNASADVINIDQSQLPGWMASIFKEWSNPTFHLTSDAYRHTATASGKFTADDDSFDAHDDRSPTLAMLSRFFQRDKEGNHSVSKGRLSKADLVRAQVIRQVDRKFIACRLPSLGHGEEGGDGMLILIDQHAADERIRVEQFLEDLCMGFLQHGSDRSVATRNLDPPRLVLATRPEADFLQNSLQLREVLARWGLALSVAESDSETLPGDSHDWAQIAVASIPEAVAVKLLLGDELRELVKAFISKFQEEGFDGIPPPAPFRGSAEEVGAETRVWMKALRWCPQELLDLLNSRACRGAIMFNDTLSVDQCERLVWQLSQTAFPFQCAHGRPSLVPLVWLNDMVGEVRASRVDWNRFSRLGDS